MYGLPLNIAGHYQSVYVSEYTDLHVIKEILVDEEYALPREFEAQRILDVGSNIGISVMYFRSRYPGSTVHAVEVDRSALRVLRRNVGSDPHVVIHELAIGAADGEREFVESAETWKSSLWTSSLGARRGRVVKVRSLASLLMEIGWDVLDLIKIDVEGAEWEVFDVADLGVCQGWIVGELHGMDGPSAASLSRAFAGFDIEIQAGGVFRARRNTIANHTLG